MDYYNIEFPIDEAAHRLSEAIKFETISKQNPDEFQGDEFTKMHAYL